MRIRLNDRELEPRTLTKSGWQELSWELPPADPGGVEMILQSDPPYQPAEGRKLGMAVGAFGFPTGR